jgi:tyrosyl-tRNA synthetase
MDAKKSLAAELVSRFHSSAAADAAREYFETRFQKKTTPSDIRQQFAAPEPIWICRLMVEVLKFAKSTSEARRLIGQGAVRVDGQVIHDVNFQFHATNHEIIEVGKNRIAQAKRIL